MAVLGEQWRWDDSFWNTAQLREFFDAGAKANLVVRTQGQTTTVTEALSALLTGNRSGVAEDGWDLRNALAQRRDSLGAIEVNCFGSKLVKAFKNPQKPGTEVQRGIDYPDEYFKNSEPEIFANLLADALKPGSLTFIDMTVVPRHKQVSMLSSLLNQARNSGWNLMASSVADADNSGKVKPRLQAFLGFGPFFDAGAAFSASTHRKGLIHLPDLTATILDYFGLEIPLQVKGQAVRTEHNLDTAKLSSAARRAAIILPAQRLFIPILSTLLSLVLIAGIWTLNRRLHPRLGKDWERPRGLLLFWRGTATFMALVPAIAFLMNLVPWWELGPVNTDQAVEEFYWFAALLPFVIAGIVTLVWEIFGFNSLMGPYAIVSALSLGIGLLDPWIGSPMMLDSIMGTQSTIGGRFYGIDNMMFAIYITGALLISAQIYGLATESTRRPLFTVLLLFAVAVVVVDAIPMLGADFGGLLAAFPAFVVLFVKLQAKRLKPLLSVLIVLFAFVLAGLLAYFDWLRPATQRTHLGNFIDSVLAGKLSEVLWGKFTQLSTAGWNPWVVGGVTFIFCVGILLLAWPLFANWRNPYRRDYAWLLGSACAKTMPEGMPLTTEEKAFIWAWLTAMTLGMLLNDSTVLIGLVGFTVAAPALLAQMAHKYLSVSIRDAQLLTTD